LRPLLYKNIDYCAPFLQKKSMSDQISETGILFKPKKTKKSAGTQVLWPVSDQVKTVFDTAKKVAKMSSIYVISNEQGQPYTTHGIATLFKRACKRAKVTGIWAIYANRMLNQHQSVQSLLDCQNEKTRIRLTFPSI